MDVVNLYTNIPVQIPRDLTILIQIQIIQILQLLEINLTHNDFTFDGKFSLQVKGMAMGKRFAPAYANIFMANWENKVFLKCPRKPDSYLRYFYDVWGIWTGSETEFQEFCDIVNSHDSSIQFTSILDRQSIDFLDTTIFKGPNFKSTLKLDIKVHFKKTDTHALLHRQFLPDTHI